MTLWVPVERLKPILATIRTPWSALPRTTQRKVWGIENGDQEYISLAAVDRLLYTLGLETYLHISAEDGGLADIYEDGAQYGSPNNPPPPTPRKYASEDERLRIRAEKIEVPCKFCGSTRLVRRDSSHRTLRSRCRRCRHEARPPKRWTSEMVIQTIHAWTREHGRPPCWTDWIAASPVNPPSETVRRLFGTWNQAIAAAGYEPRPVGSQRKAA